MKLPFLHVIVLVLAALPAQANDPECAGEKQIMAVIDSVERACKERTVYMIGRAKALRLAELVREREPRFVVECGTAIGYSGLWIARELKALGGDRKLITMEIDEGRAAEARENFKKAGLSDWVEVRAGDARKLAGEIDLPIGLVFLDCNYSNYLPCFEGIEPKLEDGALIIADNVGIGATGMRGYLERVRSEFESRTEWFDLDVPWAQRDAMEVTVFRRKPARK